MNKSFLICVLVSSMAMADEKPNMSEPVPAATDFQGAANCHMLHYPYMVRLSPAKVVCVQNPEGLGKDEPVQSVKTVMETVR